MNHLAIAALAFVLQADVLAQLVPIPTEDSRGTAEKGFMIPEIPSWWPNLPLIDDLKLDYNEGKQTTFDGSAYVDMAALAMMIPGLFNSPEYLEKQVDPVAMALLYANFTEQTPSDSPGNVLVQGAPPLQVGYTTVYRFACYRHPCGVGFGFSNEAKFASGWRADALYVTSNGNLAGKGLIQGGFTPGHAKAGFVDFVVDVTQDLRVKIYIVQDLKPLGEAFSLDFSDDPKVLSTLRPFLQFSPDNNPSVVTVVVFKSVPIQLMSRLPYRTRPAISDPQQPYQGKWRMTIEKSGKEIPVGITIMGDNQCAVRVVNTGRWACQFDLSGYIKSNGIGPTTLMMPLDKEHRLVEKFVFDKMKDIAVWGMADDDTLTLSDADLTLNWVFTRVKYEPSYQNPFIASTNAGEELQKSIQ